MSSNTHKVILFNNTRTIQRFERSEIILHWVNAVPFLILFLTGALNLLSRFEIYLSYSSPFIGAIRIIHKIAALLWVGGIGYSFFFVGRELNIANTRDQFTIGRSDITWMIKAIRSMFNRHIEVPPVGKFNIGQKINALLVILYAAAFAASGALMWVYNTMLFPWYFHASVFFMTIFSLGGHLYLSFVHPSTRPGLIGIFNGMVPRSYIEHHHGLMLTDGADEHRKTAAPEKSREPWMIGQYTVAPAKSRAPWRG
jgi:formate dehydrogenase subunit gamma